MALQASLFLGPINSRCFSVMRFNLTITVRLQAAVGALLLRQAADTEDGARSKGQG